MDPDTHASKQCKTTIKSVACSKDWSWRDFCSFYYFKKCPLIIFSFDSWQCPALTSELNMNFATFGILILIWNLIQQNGLKNTCWIHNTHTMVQKRFSSYILTQTNNISFKKTGVEKICLENSPAPVHEHVCPRTGNISNTESKLTKQFLKRQRIKIKARGVWGPSLSGYSGSVWGFLVLVLGDWNQHQAGAEDGEGTRPSADTLSEVIIRFWYCFWNQMIVNACQIR